MTDLLHGSPQAGGAAAPGAGFPMTETQQALMIGRGDAVDLGGIGCYGYFEWERPGLDPERLAGAWRRVVRRHAMLRAVARPDGTQYVLDDPPPYDIPVIDLSALSPADAEREVGALRAEMSHVVMPVGSWPLFSLRLLRMPSAPGEEVPWRLHLGIDLQVMDAASAFQVLFPDLVDLYENPDAELPGPGITFAEYARWRAGTLPGTDAYRAARAYWLERVPTLPPAPELPAGPRAGAVRFDRRERRLPAAEWQRLAAAAERAGVSPSILLTAAFAEVMRLWSATADFTINYPVFHRPHVHPDIGRVLGDFTNAVLLAADSRGATFGDRARAMAARLEQDVEHSAFNGVEVLRELTRQHGAGDRAGMPVVVTSLLDYPVRRPVDDLGREVYSISQTPQVSLDVQLRELGGELRVIWDFVAGAFAPGVIDDAFDAYVRLLGTLVDDPGRALSARRFDLVPPAQRELRRSVNDTTAEVPHVTLHELFAAQAERTPDAEAVVAAGRRLSYGELAAYAWRIGRRLRQHGARPGELVAVVMEKGWEQYAAVYGILASGAAYLPLDASVPPERLRRLLAEGRVDKVLTQSRLDARLSWPPDVHRYRVDTDFEAGDATRPETVQSPTDLAYTIFTSGSTGEPKGVMVDHRGVVNLIRDVARRFGVSGRDRLLAVSGLHFDASIHDVFGILPYGGTVVLPPPFTHAEPDVWAELVATERVTLWNSVPVLMELLVGEAEVRGRSGRGKALETLRLAVLSGDWIPLTLPDRLRALAPRVQVVGSGGPTETICWSLFYPIGAVDPGWTSIPYGKPIANQRYYIVDEAGYERPLGVAGEMAVASDIGLAHGYFGDEERTAARFVALPETGERAYLTGDLGRYLPDGNIEILGRDDFQVKIQGQRIELGEIEAALRQDPAVQAAVVVAPASAHGVRRLHAYVVPPDDAAAEPDGVLRRLAETLPSAMVPAVLTVLDALPLTRNGKVDRLALAREAGAAPEDEPDAPEPEGALERLVCAAAAEILGIERAAAGDNFFRLGGDSLSGTRLASLLTELLAVPVPVRTVFRNPELAELAAELARDTEHGAAAVLAAEALALLEDG